VNAAVTARLPGGIDLISFDVDRVTEALDRHVWKRTFG
jgi:hypothetical protein